MQIVCVFLLSTREDVDDEDEDEEAEAEERRVNGLIEAILES